MHHCFFWALKCFCILEYLCYDSTHKRTEEIIRTPQIKEKHAIFYELVCMSLRLEMRMMIDCDCILEAFCDMPCRYALHRLFALLPRK